MTFSERDTLDVDALRTDRYLEALLAAGDRAATDAPSAAELDPAIRISAARLRRDLGRVHPSFRFEERLASRLAEAAAAMRLGAAAGGEGMVVPFGAAAGGPADPAAEVDDAEAAEAAAGFHRPFLIGGAMASAALSIAGAAYIAWRRARPPLSPMAWAIRTARQRRLD